MLAEAGAKVAILDVNAKAAASEVRDRYQRSLGDIQCDVADAAATEAAIAKAAADRYGLACIVVNCAGIGEASASSAARGPMPLWNFTSALSGST